MFHNLLHVQLLSCFPSNYQEKHWYPQAVTVMIPTTNPQSNAIFMRTKSMLHEFLNSWKYTQGRQPLWQWDDVLLSYGSHIVTVHCSAHMIFFCEIFFSKSVVTGLKKWFTSSLTQLECSAKVQAAKVELFSRILVKFKVLETVEGDLSSSLSLSSVSASLPLSVCFIWQQSHLTVCNTCLMLFALLTHIFYSLNKCTNSVLHSNSKDTSLKKWIHKKIYWLF